MLYKYVTDPKRSQKHCFDGNPGTVSTPVQGNTGTMPQAKKKTGCFSGAFILTRRTFLVIPYPMFVISLKALARNAPDPCQNRMFPGRHSTPAPCSRHWLLRSSRPLAAFRRIDWEQPLGFWLVRNTTQGIQVRKTQDDPSR